MPVQTTYGFAPTTGLPGQVARIKPTRTRTLLALASLIPGIIVFNTRAAGSTGEGKTGPMTAPAAAVDAVIATGGASSGSVQNLTSFNGTLGGGEYYPPRNLTLTFSSHANWDATTATITGTDENGEAQTESLSIPDGGNATVTGTKLWRTITQISIPAQSGTAGTFTAGVGSLLGPVDHLVEGLVERDPSRASLNYASGDLAAVARDGEFYVTSETAVKEGDPVWVRAILNGDTVIGAVRATPDGNTCVRLKSARFTSTNSAGLSRLELNLPAG